MECGCLCQLPWYVCCGKDSSVCVYRGERSPVPYTLPSVDHTSPCVAVHGCLLPPRPMCTLFLFCKDSFFPSFQLLVSILCLSSFGSILLMLLYFTFSCMYGCMYAYTHVILFGESFMFLTTNFVIRPFYHLKCFRWKVIFFPLVWASVWLFSSKTLPLMAQTVSLSHLVLLEQLQTSVREIRWKQRW